MEGKMHGEVQSDERLKNVHVFMITFAGQGCVNPLLRLARRLAHFGCFITFVAPESVGGSIRKVNGITDDQPIRSGRGEICFDFFDDGRDQVQNDLKAYMVQLELVDREKLPDMILKQSARGRPVSCVIYSPFTPWVSDVAESLGIPCAVLWVQSCASFSIYHHFYHELIPFPSEEEPEIDVKMPFIPVLKHDEIPTFLHPKSPYRFMGEAILGVFKNLSKPFCVLMDTFDELEMATIECMAKICRPIKTVGPLCKSSESNAAVRADFFSAENCAEWLDGKPVGSVVYISFGSIVHLKQEQIDELAHGLLLSEVSFIWVMRPPTPPPHAAEATPLVLPEGFLERAGEDKGRIMQWASQEAVLAHPATGCFVTHCGWNSTVEALASGVPVVAFPQWGDQVTDAKYLVDVFRVGVRLCRGEAEDRIVGRDEVERCLREVIRGPMSAEIRQNAMRWQRAAEEAVAEGGSSYWNMEAFVREVAMIRGN